MTELKRVSRPDSWRADFVKRNGFRCHYCNSRGAADIGPDDRPWHIDHMEPFSKGGKDDKDSDENLVLGCQRCNLSKGARPYKHFAAFARAAWWVPDDWRISEGDLDYLMRLYTDVRDKNDHDSVWRRDEGSESIFILDSGSEIRPILRVGDSILLRNRPILELVMEMYETLPALIAEIRMHREAEPA